MKKYITEEEKNRILEMHLGKRSVSELRRFVDDFISNLDNTIIMSVLYRMLNGEKFVKGGREIYKLTDEEKSKLFEIKPKLDELLRLASEIKAEIK